MITFEQIQKANEGLTSIDLKNKAYVLVPERVKAFRKLFPEGFITTELLSLEAGVCVMKTEVGYYDGDRRVVLGTGMAYEKEANGYVNKTSYIENCETSAVGRALGFLALGIDGGGICSAEELVNAVNNQNPPVKAAIVSIKPQENPPVDMAALRTKIDAAIKARTKDMGRDEKLRFVNEVIMPVLGQRNWKLCEDPALLANLLAALEKTAA